MSILELEVHHMLELQVPCDVTLVYLKTFIMFASLNCLVQFFLPTLIFSGSFIPAAKFPSYRHSGMKPILSRSVSLLPALFDCSAPQSEVRTLLLLSLCRPVLDLRLSSKQLLPVMRQVHKISMLATSACFPSCPFFHPYSFSAPQFLIGSIRKS